MKKTFFHCLNSFVVPSKEQNAWTINTFKTDLIKNQDIEKE